MKKAIYYFINTFWNYKIIARMDSEKVKYIFG